MAVFLAGIMLLTVSGGVSAHERRALAGGKYQAVVGFLNEPAIEGQMNGIDLAITDLLNKGADGNGLPIEGLEKTLKAEVIVGGDRAKREIVLNPRFGMAGKYAGYFVPTQPGGYTFHIYGTIRDDRIDERFESGPGRFNDVEPIASLQFPNIVTAPADAQAQNDALRLRANTALVLAVVGLGVGVIGLGVAGFALRRSSMTRGDAETRTG